MDLDVRQTETTRTEPLGRVPDAVALRGAVDVIAGFLAAFEHGRYSASDVIGLLGEFSRGRKLCAAGETLGPPGRRVPGPSAHRVPDCGRQESKPMPNRSSVRSQRLRLPPRWSARAIDHRVSPMPA